MKGAESWVISFLGFRARGNKAEQGISDFVYISFLFPKFELRNEDGYEPFYTN
jgi:hypothetical protein